MSANKLKPHDKHKIKQGTSLQISSPFDANTAECKRFGGLTIQMKNLLTQ